MELRCHYAATPGYTQLVTPHTHPVERLDFGALRLEGGQTYEMASDGSEVGLVVLSGTCSLRVNGEHVAALGERASVFDGRASGAYIPPDASFQVEAGQSGVEIAVCRCAASAKYPVQVIRPADVVARQVGGPGYLRYVHDILGPQIQAASMLVGETFTIAGNWSSFPPHKHDVDALPDEVKQEELYFYKIRPAEGFGIQYIYSREGSPYGALEQALAVHQNDVTIMPFGYHPVAAPPGYDVHYLWFLAGATRLMRPHDDPAYAWIKTAHEGARDYPK